jgi:hypothetical protein
MEVSSCVGIDVGGDVTGAHENRKANPSKTDIPPNDLHFMLPSAILSDPVSKPKYQPEEQWYDQRAGAR